MSDIKTLFIDFGAGADVLLDGALLANDDGLDTAVILSLFTDALARDDDRLPHGATDRRGWWADALDARGDDRIGSRLWLLLPGKQIREVMAAAREYTEEALAWLVRDGIAKRVEVAASNPRDGLLALSVAIHKPDGSSLQRRFEMLWSA